MKTQGEKDVLNYLGHILKSGIDSNIDFIVKGETIVGHKLILRDRGPVFNYLINNAASTDQINIKDTEPKVFRELLHYLYTGDAPNAEEDDITEPLLIAARTYKVESLEQLCSSILSSKLNKYSATNLLIFAHQNSVNSLKENCIDFIVKNSKYFTDQREFQLIGKTNLSLFLEITKCKQKLMDGNVSSSKTSSREDYLTYDQIQEQTKSKTLKSTVASSKDDQHDAYYETTTETDSQQPNDESEIESNYSLRSFASSLRAAVYERSDKKKSPSSISKSRTESSSGIDLRSYYSSATSAQTVNTIHQNYRCKYLILLIAA